MGLPHGAVGPQAPARAASCRPGHPRRPLADARGKDGQDHGTMRLSDILSSAAVRSQAQVSSKKRLFHDLADMAAAAYGLDAAATLDALQERESLGATGVGHGVALPHARIPGLDHVAGLFLRLEKPMDFDAVDRQPVDLVFALLAPDSPGVEHLKALALVSRTLRDPDLRAKLRANDDPDALHAVLAAAQSTKAA